MLMKQLLLQFFTGQWKHCCDRLMKIETLSSRKPITMKKGSLYHEKGNISKSLFPVLSCPDIPGLHFSFIFKLCKSWEKNKSAFISLSSNVIRNAFYKIIQSQRVLKDAITAMSVTWGNINKR